jgi:hypothetical protein
MISGSFADSGDVIEDDAALQGRCSGFANGRSE